MRQLNIYITHYEANLVRLMQVTNKKCAFVINACV